MIKVISLFIFFLGCNGKQDISFEALYSSFSDWSVKYDYAPILKYKGNLLQEKHFLGENKYADMKRFLIELNQLNGSKISEHLKMEYLLLNRHLKSNIFKN